MFENVSTVFRVFGTLFFYMDIPVVFALIVVSCKRAKDSAEQLRRVFRDVTVVGVIFCVLSWLFK